jgi:Gpi18-like mannosyltransferase
MNGRVIDINETRDAGGLAAPPATQSACVRRMLPALILLLIVAGAFRLHLAWWKGHLGDLLCFQAWAVPDMHWTPATQGPPIPIPNHPPLYLSVTRVLYWLHEALRLRGDIRTPIDDFELFHIRPIIVLYKIPAILADLVAGAILFAWAAAEGRRWSALGIAAFYLFSPAILYDGAYYGQTDTILCTLLIAATFAYTTRRPGMLGCSVMLAAFLKAQAVCALPILALAVALEWRTVWARHARRLFVSALLTTAGVVALAAITGNLIQFYRGYFTVIGGVYDRTSINAMNLWWLLTRPWNKTPGLKDFPPDTHRWLGLVSYRTLGLAAFALAVALIVWRWRLAKDRPGSIVLACAAASWAFFNLCTEMHERYSVVAVGLTCVAVIWNRRWYLYGTLASITTMLNVVFVLPLFYPPWRWLQAQVNWFIWPEYGATHTIMAVVEVLMLPLVVEALWQAGRASARVREPSGHSVA